MRTRNVRHRQWLRYARRLRMQGREHWSPGFERHMYRWVRRGDWRPRIARKYPWSTGQYDDHTYEEQPHE